MKIKVSRKKDYRELMARNLVTSLILHENITTTPTKAKIAESLFARLITNTKTADLNAKKNSRKVLLDNNASKKLFEVIIPRLMNEYGNTSTVRLNNRLGDNAPQVRLSILLKPLKIEAKEKNIKEDK